MDFLIKVPCFKEGEGSPGEMANVLDCDMVGSEFEF